MPGNEDDSVKLFWVKTDDHDEDWFVVADNERAAAAFHERAEGYEEGEAYAELVADVPSSAEGPEGWPSLKLIAACGGQILRDETPRAVKFGERTYVEGLLEHEVLVRSDDALQQKGKGRLNGTPPKEEH